jgi:potassium efflux system protein
LEAKKERLDAGARCALTTISRYISRYAISAVGVIIAFNSIGLNWSRLQWLVAARLHRCLSSGTY